VKRLHASWKLAGAITHLLTGLLTMLVLFPRMSQAQQQERVQTWSAGMVKRLGIRIIVSGQPAVNAGTLLMANHVSWLDITALHAAQFCRFVSKGDVRQWPVIGFMAAQAGTLFIERASRRDAMRVVHQMADSLRAGDVLAVFPEGTTSDGAQLLPFHANLFQAAIAAGAPVQPMAIGFIDHASGEPSLAPCYIDEDTLLGSVWRTLCTPGIAVVIRFGEPQMALGKDRRAWAAHVRESIGQLRESPLDLF
jgi:1-acyl-sn-glycerol-3-phosphate acyltransferase